MKLIAFGDSHVFGHEHTQFDFHDPNAELQSVIGRPVRIDKSGLIDKSEDRWSLASLWLQHLIKSAGGQEEYKRKCNATSYAKIVGDIFGIESINHAERGSGMVRIYMKFLENISNINPTDLVVIGFTSPWRYMQTYQFTAKTFMVESCTGDALVDAIKTSEDFLGQMLKIHAICESIKSLHKNSIFVNIDWHYYRNIARMVDDWDLCGRYTDINKSIHYSTVEFLQSYFNNLFINDKLARELMPRENIRTYLNHFDIETHQVFGKHIAEKYEQYR